MKLYLVRHGDYANLGIKALDTLTEKGQLEIEKIARFLSQQAIKVADIYHSGKNRAKQTAALLTTTVGCESLQAYSGLTPLDPVDPIATDLTYFENDTLIVSHLPFLSRLLGKLVANNSNVDLVNFNTGTLVALERLDHERFIINWVIEPNLF